MSNKTSLLKILAAFSLAAGSTLASAQVDSVTNYGTRGNVGVNVLQNAGTEVPVLPSPPATGIGGVPAGYEEISVPLPGPGASISQTTASVLASIGYSVTRVTSDPLTGVAACGASYTGYVWRNDFCPDGFYNDITGDSQRCTPSTTYNWCGATGTATVMRKIETNGRIPTQLDIDVIRATSTAAGTQGMLNDAGTMKKICAMNGYVSVWSYLGYEYDPGGTFRRCGTRPTTYWTGSTWGMTNSCSAISQLTCY